MTSKELQQRTKKFALDVIDLVGGLPANEAARFLGEQVVRSGTSIGAHYRAVSRAKSPLDTIHKLRTVEDELERTIYWLELLEESKLNQKAQVGGLQAEANEIRKVLAESIETLRAQNPAPRSISVTNHKSSSINPTNEER